MSAPTPVAPALARTLLPGAQLRHLKLSADGSFLEQLQRTAGATATTSGVLRSCLSTALPTFSAVIGSTKARNLFSALSPAGGRGDSVGERGWRRRLCGEEPSVEGWSEAR